MMLMTFQPRCFRLAFASLAVVGVAGSPRVAVADDKQVCLEAYDKSQTLRQEDKLVGAREQLLICARNVCPEILRKDCTQWLDDVDRSLPTIVLAVKDSRGQDLVDVTVTVDGEPFVTQIDGKAVPVDPGVRMFRFAVPGEEPLEKRIVIHAAAKNRPIAIQFRGEEGSGDTPPGGEDAQSGGPPTAAYVFGGIGLVGLGAFAYFGTQFDSKLDEMDACKPNCAQADADDASFTRTMAFVSAGIGVVSLGVATYLFVSSSGQETAEVSSVPRIDLMPVRGGAVGSFGGRF